MEDDRFPANKTILNIFGTPGTKSVQALKAHEAQCEADLNKFLGKAADDVLAFKMIEYSNYDAPGAFAKMCDPFRSTLIANQRIPNNADLYYFTKQIKETHISPQRYKVNFTGSNRTASTLMSYLRIPLETCIRSGYGSLLAMMLFNLKKWIVDGDEYGIGGDKLLKNQCYKAQILPHCLLYALSEGHSNVQPIVVHVILAAASAELGFAEEFKWQFLTFGPCPRDTDGNPPLSIAIKSHCSRRVLMLLLIAIGTEQLKMVGFPNFYSETRGNTPFHVIALEQNVDAAYLLRVFMVKNPADPATCRIYDEAVHNAPNQDELAPDQIPNSKEIWDVAKTSDSQKSRKSLLDRE